MQSFVSFTQGAFKTVMTVGAIALTVAGASLAATAPAEAFVRHGGGFHHFGGARFGGFHRFGYGAGRHFGGYGFRRGIVGHRGFGASRFAYRIGVPSYGYGYGFRRCAIGRHFVRGLGCRVNAVYGYRPFVYGARRIARPFDGYGFRQDGVHRYGFGHGRPFGGYHHGAGHVGLGHGGTRHAGFGGFGHGGHIRRR